MQVETGCEAHAETVWFQRLKQKQLMHRFQNDCFNFNMRPCSEEFPFDGLRLEMGGRSVPEMPKNNYRWPP
jgi:hypothetical protein